MQAIFFDGESARDHVVEVKRFGDVLDISGTSVALRSWTLSGLHSIDPPSPGQPFRLTHDKHPGERLIVHDGDFIEALLQAVPRLRTDFLPARHFRQVLAWTVGGIAAVALAGYLLFTLLPSYGARMLPDSWRQTAGEQVVKSITANANLCTASAGVAAFDKMLKRLAAQDGNFPDIKISVYDMSLLNAFAVPGRGVIFTSEILKQADSPDEIASVLAHEAGHVAHFHPEEQMVRVAGLQVLTSLFGGSGSETLSNVAGVAALLTYSRNAERDADTFARETMVHTAIDPMAFKRFFEKLLKMEAADTSSKETSALRRIGDMFSTHPDTPSRIAAIQPLPAGVKAEPSLTADEWKDLKAICE